MYTATTTNTSVTITNTTIIAAQYLNITQGINDGGQTYGISCYLPCSSEVNSTWYFPVPNNTFFYSQIDVNAKGVGVAIFPNTANSDQFIAVTLEITNTTITESAYFVILVSDSKLPLTVYVWYYGTSS